MTYKEIGVLISRMPVEQQDKKARVIEKRVFAMTDEGICPATIDLGAEFELTDLGIDETGQPYLAMPFLPDPEPRSQDGQAVS